MMKNIKSRLIFEKSDYYVDQTEEDKLLSAVRKQDIDTIKKILDSNIEISESVSSYALELAVSNHLNDISILLAADSRFNPQKIITYALKYSDGEVIEALLSNENMKSLLIDEDYSEYLLRYIIEAEIPDNINILLKHINVDEYVLADAAENLIRYNGSSLSVVIALKHVLNDSRTNLSNLERRLIKYASKHKSPVFMKMLIDDIHLNPSVNNNYALKQAEHDKNTELLNVLLANNQVVSKLNKNNISDNIRKMLIELYNFLNTSNDVDMYLSIL